MANIGWGQKWKGVHCDYYWELRNAMPGGCLFWARLVKAKSNGERDARMKPRKGYHVESNIGTFNVIAKTTEQAKKLAFKTIQRRIQKLAEHWRIGAA